MCASRCSPLAATAPGDRLRRLPPYRCVRRRPVGWRGRVRGRSGDVGCSEQAHTRRRGEPGHVRFAERPVRRAARMEPGRERPAVRQRGPTRAQRGAAGRHGQPRARRWGELRLLVTGRAYDRVHPLPPGPRRRLDRRLDGGSSTNADEARHRERVVARREADPVHGEARPRRPTSSSWTPETARCACSCAPHSHRSPHPTVDASSTWASDGSAPRRRRPCQTSR